MILFHRGINASFEGIGWFVASEANKDVNVNYIFKKKRNLMFRKNGIIIFRTFDKSLEACDSQFAIL